MDVSQEKTQQLVDLTRRKYPDWETFEHPEFAADEIIWKRETIQKAQELLSQPESERLLAESGFDEIIDRLDKIGQDNILLWRSVPMKGDLGILYQPELDKPSFCQAVYELLYGDGPSPERLDRYAAYVEDQDLPNKWTFPTYYLFICHPDHEMFVKPRTTQWFLKLIDGPKLGSDPDGEVYQTLLEAAQSLRENLEPHNPRDMVDIQSLIWVGYLVDVKKETSETTLAPPLSEIFATRDEAEWAFNLLQETLQAVGITVPDDERFALTRPSKFGGAGLRLSIGNWLVLGFHRTNRSQGTRVEIALARDQVPALNNQIILRFKQEPDEPAIASYELDIDTLRPMSEAISQAYQTALQHIRTRFEAWQRSNYRYAHEPQLARAIFDLEYREQLMDDGLEEAADLQPDPNSAFSPETFELLEGLHENPDKAYYMEHQTEIDDYIRQPFKALFRDIAEQLPEEITDVMETDKRLFSRILKNDFGRGGAWDHYWGAFYPQGTKRTESAQLMLWVNWHRVEFGFYIGEYGNEPRQRFLHNWGENESFLRDYLQDVLPRAGVRFGSRPEGMTLVPQDQTDLEKWSNQLDETDIQIAIPQSKQQILTWSKDELSTQIVRTFEALFPLVLLATFDDPMPAIGRYLEPDGEDEELQPPYPMAQMMQDTHLDADTLTRWVRAINRKGQAVLYGPPGTGKTYVAERLARHLIGDGDGFSELVQFHPAYAYEDFIQGIRPRTRGDGELTYKMVPGRFLDFCDKARRRQDTCVLIVDEINRANLSRVFGELMYLLEYRGKDKAIPLAGGKAFSIPDNVRLIGTMNTADRSIALVDHALRRRFAFLPLWPKYEVLHRYHRGRATHVNLAGLIDTLRDVNNQIGDRNYHLGITFFLVPDLDEHVADIWRVEIVPYLEEYFFDNPGQVDAFRWQQVRDQIQS